MFENPIVVEGAGASLVKKVETDVVVPGDSHDDLWVHPEMISVPGDLIICELRARRTDRDGRDQHAESYYFRTADDFRTLHPIDHAPADGWKRIALRPEDIERHDAGAALPPDAKWSWYMNYIHLDTDTVVQPFYCDIKDNCRSIRTVVARIEGDRAVPLHVSNALTNNYARGFLEPHLARHGGDFFMTVRAEDGRGYVMKSEDGGRSWNNPAPWRWDDGEVIPMHTTMTKLISHSDGMALVYTRIREDNQEYFRSRTPLHLADVDTGRLVLKKDTERVIVPNRSEKTGRGARSLGNFWVWPVNADKSYVVVGEWMRDGGLNNGDIWLCKIHWKQCNQHMSPDGREQLGSDW